jgi:hypothetical protein
MPKRPINKRKLTQLYVERISPQAKTFCAWDSEQKGLCLRVRPNGHRSYKVVYPFQGRTRWYHLGAVNEISLGQARRLAQEVMYAKAQGHDPHGEQIRVKEARARAERLDPIAEKALRFLQEGIKPACYLYRHYHPNGDLLSGGISLNPFTRQRQHFDLADWRYQICRIVIEPFKTREQALAAEHEAIRVEFPKFNVMHNGYRHPLKELARVPKQRLKPPEDDADD